MKRFIQWTALTALVISLSSCGLPGAAVRTATIALAMTGGVVPTATGTITSSGKSATGSGTITLH